MKSIPTLTLYAVSALALAAPSLSACGKKETPAQPATATGEAAGATGEAATAGTAQGKPAPGTETGSGAAVADAGAPAAPDEAAPAGTSGPFATPALASVPKTAPFVVVVNPKKLLDSLGYQGLLDKYAMLFGEAAEQMKTVAGKDLMKLESWSEIGVELDAPAGLFMPDLEHEAFVSFVTLSDPAKLKSFIDATAKKMEVQIATETIDGATLMTVGTRDRNAWMINGNLLYSVGLDRGQGAMDMLKGILSREEADSITSTPGFSQMLEGIGADEGGAIVQLGMVFKLFTVREMSATDTLAADIEAAKKAGDQERVKELEARREEARYWEERRAAENELMTMLGKELSTMSIGLDISERAAEAKVKLGLDKGGVLANIVKNGTEVSPLLGALDKEPLILLSAHIDPARYLSLVEKAMAAEGDDLAEARERLKEHLSVDLDKDLIGNLTGEVGFALTGDITALMASEDPQRQMGGVLLVGLKSEEPMKKLLGNMAKSPELAEIMTWDEGSGTLDIRTPVTAPIRVRVANNRLVASTDMDIASKLNGGGGYVASITNPKLKALLERKDLAGLFLMPQKFSMAWLVLGRGGYSPVPELPPDASAEAKAKAEEITKLDAEIDTLRAKVEEESMRPAMQASEKLGVLAEGVTVADDGLHATVGLYTNAPVPEVVASMVDLTMEGMRRRGATEPSADEQRLRELEQKRWKLQSELWDMERPKPPDDFDDDPE